MAFTRIMFGHQLIDEHLTHTEREGDMKLKKMR